MIDQIKCPKRGSNNYSIPRFVNVWLPELETYAIDYSGLGEIFDTTSNKKSDKVAIGYNKFIPLGEDKCGIKSDKGCWGEQKHVYLKTYPLGFMPTCKNNETVGKYKVIGGTGLVGSIQEDLYNLDVGDSLSGIFGAGPLRSNDCMKVKLPVGEGMLRWKEATKEEVENRGFGWYTEEKCVPRQPTVNKDYGGQTFTIPYSQSKCTEEFTNESKVETKQSMNGLCLLLLLALLLCILYVIYNSYSKKSFNNLFRNSSNKFSRLFKIIP
tara:strand:+ start:767 stop:1570 length:804 start_codon:yes stop_codon:yes gene_type:complete